MVAGTAAVEMAEAEAIRVSLPNSACVTVFVSHIAELRCGRYVAEIHI